jgi:hypothetical protein|tara:strand:- start:529 stop:990 length:462 start_codon:yes stop_codon:yes gene_type:complete
MLYQNCATEYFSDKLAETSTPALTDILSYIDSLPWKEEELRNHSDDIVFVWPSIDGRDGREFASIEGPSWPEWNMPLLYLTSGIFRCAILTELSQRAKNHAVSYLLDRNDGEWFRFGSECWQNERHPCEKITLAPEVETFIKKSRWALDIRAL